MEPLEIFAIVLLIFSVFLLCVLVTQSEKKEEFRKFIQAHEKKRDNHEKKAERAFERGLKASGNLHLEDARCTGYEAAGMRMLFNEIFKRGSN